MAALSSDSALPPAAASVNGAAYQTPSPQAPAVAPPSMASTLDSLAQIACQSDPMEDPQSGPARSQPQPQTPTLRDSAIPYPTAQERREKLKRTRSGCQTCRIRRKKCDEPSDRNGSCLTCTRLSLQCLGYAEKRADWMRDPIKLNQCKRDIRLFLAENGRKGTAATERLTFDKYFDDNSNSLPSPAPPSTVAIPVKPHRREVDWDSDDDDDDSDHNMGPQSQPPGSSAGYVYVHPGAHPARSILGTAPGTGIYSTIPSPYRSASAAASINQQQSQPNGTTPTSEMRSETEAPPSSDLINIWVERVSLFQPVHTTTLGPQLEALLHTSPEGLEVTKILTDILMKIVNDKNDQRREDIFRDNQPNMEIVKKRLETASVSQVDDPGIALAAILAICLISFASGVGDWESYLSVACNWLRLTSKNFLQGNEVPPSSLFLAETIIWIDIIGATSLQKAPKLQTLYRQLLEHDYKIDLKRVLGCDNRTMLGLAEAAFLADWKEVEASHGRLDLYTLTSSGRQIAEKFFSHIEHMRPAFMPMPSPVPIAPPVPPGPLTPIYRMAAKVYLHTVVLGSFPSAEPMVTAVEEAIATFKTLPLSRDAPAAADVAENGVVEEADPYAALGGLRALVFPIAIVACMARDEAQKDFFHAQLESMLTHARSGGAGAVKEAHRIVQEVWDRRLRSSSGRDPISWWNVMNDLRAIVLLA